MTRAADRQPAMLRNPWLLVPFLLGASSISTLLSYFFGFVEMRSAALFLLAPCCLILLGLTWRAKSRQPEMWLRIVTGVWAGVLATAAYDLVRVPIVWSGTPVFKAISYFGTVLLGIPSPTLWSEVAGWSYHLSNGVGFAIMYTCLVSRPRWWTAVLWGTSLEAAMLLTPYAEVFGYRVAPKFIAITLGSHVVYGLVLWGASRSLIGDSFGIPPRLGARRLLPGLLLAVAAISWVAADFHRRHASRIAPSPPSYLGAHLYTTWNRLEPDRLSAIWIMKRFSDSNARFHFVDPFSTIAYGKPFDVPEAETRRGATESATENLVARLNLGGDARLQALTDMTHLYEISRWTLPARPEAAKLGQDLMSAAGSCRGDSVEPCVEKAMEFLDQWYRRP